MFLLYNKNTHTENVDKRLYSYIQMGVWLAFWDTFKGNPLGKGEKLL